MFSIFEAFLFGGGGRERLFAPRMVPNMNINGNKGKIALGKKKTFKVLKVPLFIC